MFTRNELVEVFKDTQKWISSNEKLSGAVNYSINNTKVYFEDEYPEYEKRTDCKMKISVTKDKSSSYANSCYT